MFWSLWKIYCDINGEYICPDDFSTFEGFSDGIPTKTTEKLDEKESDELLNIKQKDNKKRITNLCNVFNIEFSHLDLKFIIDIYDTIDEVEIINKRYNQVDSYKKHPKNKEIKEKYNFFKPAKTHQEKKSNRKNNLLMKEEKENLKKELIEHNHIVSDLFFVLLISQISNPQYNIPAFLLFNKLEHIQNINSK